MTVDEILGNPAAALELPEGAIPTSILIICEYANPGSQHLPDRGRLSMCVDDSMNAWRSMGLLHFALARETAQIDRNIANDPDE